MISHGAWHTPEHYADLVDQLHTAGFSKVLCPQHLSATTVLPFPESATLDHDTSQMHQIVKQVVEDGHPVILLMHSWGGVVGNNASDGLLWPQRQAQGLPGGIVHLVYFSAFVMPAGTNMVAPFSGNIPPWIDEDPETHAIAFKDLKTACYNHIQDDAVAQYWLDKTVLCPGRLLRDVQTFAPYEYIGSGLDATYLVLRDDYELKSYIQEGMATLLGESRRMEYLDSGHCAMIGNAKEIADVVKQAWAFTQSRG